MEIVVAGRHQDVPARFRAHAEQKLAKVAQFAPRAQRVDLLLAHEANPRLVDASDRVELTVVDRGPVVRAEASAADAYVALDLALDKLVERLRRVGGRRKDRRVRGSVPPAEEPPAPDVETAPGPQDRVLATDGEVTEVALGDSPVVIREKVHRAVPISVDDALDEMELVGHPFYLFVDAETGQPSVVYRRHGWTYGVIKLDTSAAAVGSVV